MRNVSHQLHKEIRLVVVGFDFSHVDFGGDGLSQ
jgi:hypothetical protein